MLLDLGPPHPTLTRALKGHADAIRFVQALVRVCDVWDDLIDGDVEAAPERIHQAFVLALLELPASPFFRQNHDALYPVLLSGVLSWWSANQLEQRPSVRARSIAYVARSQIAEVITVSAALIGGLDWAREIGPEVKLFIHSDDPRAYADEMEKKHGMAVDPEA